MTTRPSETKAQATTDEARYGLRPLHVLLVFLAAAVFRGLYLLEAMGEPEFDLVSMDPEYNLEWAKAIASGVWNEPYQSLRGEAFFRSPLYSYVLAVPLALFGENLLVARIFQLLIGSVSCALAYCVATKCLGRSIGLGTGLLCSAYWVLVYFDAEFLLPVALVFLSLTGFLCLFLAAERRSVLWAGLGGLALGLFAITRPNILLCFPAVLLWAGWIAVHHGIARRLLFVAAVTIGCALPPALVTLRNKLVSGDWVIVASQGGVNFYIGNNPESNGWQAVVPGTRATWWGGRLDTISIAEREAGLTLTASEVSDYWYGQAFDYIRAEPGAWLKLSGRKLLGFVGDAEIPSNEPFEARRSRYWSLSIVPLSFALLFAPFLVAAVLLVWRRAGARFGIQQDSLRRSFTLLLLSFAAIYALSVIAFFVTGRYRVPLLPIFALGCATWVWGLQHALRSRRFKEAALLFVATLGLTMFLGQDLIDVRAETAGWIGMTEAQDCLRRGDVDGAIELLEQVRRDGSMQRPEFYKVLGATYQKKQDFTRAAEVGAEAVELFTNDAQLALFAAEMSLHTQDWPAASRFAEHHLSLNPADPMPGIFCQFVAALEGGRRAEAQVLLERARQRKPGHRLTREMEARW